MYTHIIYTVLYAQKKNGGIGGYNKRRVSKMRIKKNRKKSSSRCGGGRWRWCSWCRRQTATNSRILLSHCTWAEEDEDGEKEVEDCHTITAMLCYAIRLLCHSLERVEKEKGAPTITDILHCWTNCVRVINVPSQLSPNHHLLFLPML